MGAGGHVAPERRLGVGVLHEMCAVLGCAGRTSRDGGACPGRRFARYDGLFGASPADPALAEKLTRVSADPRLPALRDRPVPNDAAADQAGTRLLRGARWLRGTWLLRRDRAEGLARRSGQDAEPGLPAFADRRVGSHKPKKPDAEVCRKRGSNALVAMMYMANYGSLTYRDVPTSRICEPAVTEMTIDRNEFSIRDIKVIYVREKDVPFTDVELDKVKQQLAAGNPVIIGVAMYRYFEDPTKEAATLEALKAGRIYEGSLGRNYGQMDNGHELVIVGYDEGRQAFKLQNSWGQEWADGGYGWIQLSGGQGRHRRRHRDGCRRDARRSRRRSHRSARPQHRRRGPVRPGVPDRQPARAAAMTASSAARPNSQRCAHNMATRRVSHVAGFVPGRSARR